MDKRPDDPGDRIRRDRTFGGSGPECGFVLPEGIEGRSDPDSGGPPLDPGIPEMDDKSTMSGDVPGGDVPGGDVPGEAASRKGLTETPARNSLLEALVLVLLALVLALTLKTYVAEAYEIKGRSMVPTFENGERVVVLKVLYEVERGDVVIFSSQEDPTKDLIKRVVGLPGEHLRIDGGKVYIDGRVIAEEYVDDSPVHPHGTEEDLTLGPESYYVLGDNRDDSHDSRRFGAISSSKFKGKVIVRWWPFHQVETF